MPSELSAGISFLLSESMTHSEDITDNHILPAPSTMRERRDFVDISKNMSAFVRAYKELQGKSYTECAKELGIAASTMKAYAAGNAHPSAYMLEHLAEKMGADPAVFVIGDYSSDQIVILVKLMDLAKLLEKAPPEDRCRFACLLWQMVLILNRSDDTQR